MTSTAKNRGWTVTFAGMGINLALGILYSWSIFKVAIQKSIEKGGPGSFNWPLSSLNDPYAICCVVFAFAMILSGRCQDRFGPRITALIGGILVGIGFIWISQTTSYLAWILGFGLLAGTGIGFGYGAATPPALKWFPAAKTGLIAGLVVSGFGLASVYIAPLSKYLIGVWGLRSSMMLFGIAFLIIVSILSTFMTNPPKDYSPGKQSKGIKRALSPAVDVGPAEMLKTRSFYTLWVTFFIGAGAGLMVIGSVAGMAQKSLGEMAFIAVATMAIGNAAGRILAGFISDKIGRKLTLVIMLIFQAVLMFASIPLVKGGSGVTLVVVATLIGCNYGTNLSLFPSFTKDLWGLKNFGTNYGLVFASWGVGGFVMGRLSQMLRTATGNFDSSFLTAGIMLLIGAALVLTLKRPVSAVVVEEEKLPVFVTRAVIADRAWRDLVAERARQATQAINPNGRSPYAKPKSAVS